MHKQFTKIEDLQQLCSTRQRLPNWHLHGQGAFHLIALIKDEQRPSPATQTSFSETHHRCHNRQRSHHYKWHLQTTISSRGKVTYYNSKSTKLLEEYVRNRKGAFRAIISRWVGNTRPKTNPRRSFFVEFPPEPAGGRLE